ncbi:MULTISPECIES: leucyl aminopeptidase [unclassified Leifsonia]|uniref:leucyl aminopeptidase n=1 Tax=unclassified Leifsonia TaxID=2663824 RepID=UPI0006F96B78|nr:MULTISPECIES: leucyl aminopeptidase [unclassified Leifsonia]KQX07028.1 aminopeptidase [Leifsonia sp. Root1293]KRA11311.1 aminopeptidase [Leifsonia sp. Root60]
MTSATLSFSSAPVTEAAVDVVVIGARSVDGSVELVADPAYAGIAEHLDALGVTGAADQLVRTVDTVGTARTIAIIGLGRGTDAAALRAAAGSAARQLTGIDTLAFAIPTDGSADAAAIAEGAVLGAYAYTAYRHASLEKTKTPASSIVVHTTVAPAEEEQARIGAVADGVNLVRDLVNAPPSDLYPESFVDRAGEAIGELPIDVTVWDEAQLADDGFGGILGVGKGSARPPRLLKLAYSPAAATAHLAIVGKGITFDTGGLSLKPPVPMIGMKSDMAGAANVLAVIVAAARTGLPVRLTGWLCLAENMPSGNAVRPNDVLSIRGGTTVEVVNTDAEGRLVMADGLVAASEEFPDAIVDVATLTGAQVVALGHRYSAVMGEDELVARVISSSASVGEPFWAMPIPEELRARLDSGVADIKNATPGDPAAGMMLAAAFLKDFIGKTADGDAMIPWAHLDIAGAALNEGKPFGFTGPGATGVSVRTLLALAESFTSK